MISVKQLEAFLTSARWGNFVAAAARLNTTQSNVSKRIQELEWSIGTPVFERGPRSLTLTIKGKQLLPHAQEVLAAYTKFSEIAAPDSPFSGPLNIGSTPAIALSWLSDFLHRVRRDYPDVVLNPQVGNKPTLSRSLTNGLIDLAFAAIPLEADDVETIPLATEELIWVCHPSLAPRTKRLTLDQLATLPLIEHPSDDNEIHRLFTDRGIRTNKVATCSSYLARTRFATSGLGVTHLPRYAIKNQLARKRLIIIDCDVPLPPIRYVAIFRRGEASPLPSRLATIAKECCNFGLFLQ